MYKHVPIVRRYMCFFQTRWEIQCSDKLAWWTCVSHPYFSYTGLSELQWQTPQNQLCFGEFFAQGIWSASIFFPHGSVWSAWVANEACGDPLWHWKESYWSDDWFHHWTAPQEQILAGLCPICSAGRSKEGGLPAWEVPPLQWRHQWEISIPYVWRWLKNIFFVLGQTRIFCFTASLFLGSLSGMFLIPAISSQSHWEL